MKKLTLLTILLLGFLTTQMHAQTALLSLSNQVINGTTVTFDINIEASDDNIYLGNSDFVLSFNNGAFSNPALSISEAGDFRTESDSDSDASATQDNYLFATATDIINGNLVINLSGPNPANMLAFERRVGKFPNGVIRKLGTFQITGYQSGNVNLGWIDGSTLLSTITLPDFIEVQVTVETSNILPVEMTLFEAILDKENTVDLRWETVSEKNNDGFEVQYSQDGMNWSELSFVPGQGTTNDFQSYTYVHQEAKVGNNYYRLKQIDLDGSFEYSNIEVVQLEGSHTKISIYPNPAVDVVNVEMDRLESTQDIIIYDQQGKIVHREIVAAGDTKASIQLGHLASGIYLISIPGQQNNYQTQNLVIQR